MLVVALLATPGPAGAAKRCGNVVDPYEGTRYENADLTGIRAQGVRCSLARRVARAGHRRALAAVPDERGFVHVRWHGWRVQGDLRPSRDRYIARRHEAWVRWRF